MKKDFLEELQTNILVLFAPMQTLLLDWGKDLESHLSGWILSNPQKYQEALLKSYEAGCDMGHTGTQASSVFRAKPFGLEKRIHELNYRSAILAKEVTPPGRFVVGNISGSNPDFLEPWGGYTEEFVRDGYKEQILALAEGGVDGLHISGNHQESMVIAVRAAKELTGLPVIAHNSYYKMKKGYRTLMGYSPEKATTMLADAGADVVGAICGQWSYEDGIEIIRQMRTATDRVLGCQPDAGLPDLLQGTTVYPATPDEIAEAVPKWVAAGARVVGGCCGTTLEHYSRVAREVQKLRRKAKP